MISATSGSESTRDFSSICRIRMKCQSTAFCLSCCAFSSFAVKITHVLVCFGQGIGAASSRDGNGTHGGEWAEKICYRGIELGDTK